MTDDHTAPSSTDASVTGDGDDAAMTDNLFDAAPAGRTGQAGDVDAADDAALVDGAAPVPADVDVATEDPRDDAEGQPGPLGDGDAAGAADGDPDEAADAGPDWERLAAEDPRTSGELLADLAAVTVSRDEYLDSLQRKQAEFENFRRRMQQQSAQQRVAGHADVAGRVLEVLDDFDRTLASIATSADDGVVKGVTLVRDKLMAALREVGLERVDDQGAPFDPNRHEAVQQVAGDGTEEAGAEPVVAEVLRPGYVLGSRVLRAAMVAVTQ